MGWIRPSSRIRNSCTHSIVKEENSQNDFEDIENIVHGIPKTGRVRF